MDSFGRLPTDVIDTIVSLYNTTTFEFIDHGDQKVEMIITGTFNINIDIMTPLCNMNGIDTCNQYELTTIKNLIDNKRGHHVITYEDEIFSIMIDQIITIKSNDVSVKIPIIYIDAFISGLQQYYNLLDKYPKNYLY